MPNVDDVKQKVQRILTDNLGSVRIDRDGDFVIQHESAVSFVSLDEWADDSVYVYVRSPMVNDVPITNELCRWIATEGQSFRIGGTYLSPDDNGKTGTIIFKYGILGDDLDESELMVAVHLVVSTANKLDDELCDRFGGRLFTNPAS